MSTPEPRADPKAPPQIVRVTKRIAARTQLETAILLWFDYGDPVSIHALAVAANDCYHAIGKDAGKPSLVQEWVEAQSNSIRTRVRYAQNFFKHGLKDLKSYADFPTKHTEVLMFDSVVQHEQLFGAPTAAMLLFKIRFLLFSPEAAADKEHGGFLNERYIDGFRTVDRRDFMHEFLPCCLEDVGG